MENSIPIEGKIKDLRALECEILTIKKNAQGKLNLARKELWDAQESLKRVRGKIEKEEFALWLENKAIRDRQQEKIREGLKEKHPCGCPDCGQPWRNSK